MPRTSDKEQALSFKRWLCRKQQHRKSAACSKINRTLHCLLCRNSIDLDDETGKFKQKEGNIKRLKIAAGAQVIRKRIEPSAPRLVPMIPTPQSVNSSLHQLRKGGTIRPFHVNHCFTTEVNGVDWWEQKCDGIFGDNSSFEWEV